MGSNNTPKSKPKEDGKSFFNNKKLPFICTKFKDDHGIIHVAETFEEYMKCVDKRMEVVSVGSVHN